MKRRTRTWLGVAGALLLLPLPAAFLGWPPAEAAPENREGYNTITAAPGVIRNGALDGADSLDWTSPISTSGATLSVFKAQTNPTVAVSARMSVSGATATISVGLYHLTSTTFTFMGVAGVQTATGGTNIDTNGEFVAPTLFFDTAGATHYEIRKTDPSDTSTVRLIPWSYGAISKGAQ